MNGPLTGMNLTLQACRNLVRAPAIHKLFDAFESDLSALAQLLEELKSLNRRETYRLKPIDLGAELAALVEEPHKHPSIFTIKFERAETPLIVAGEVARLRRVWQNLLTNVREATTTATQLQIRVRKSGNMARITFKDNAGGITKQRLTRLFEPFFTTKGGKNRGLGLFIARKIITEHNGKIRIASRKPFTRVTIELPLIV